MPLCIEDIIFISVIWLDVIVKQIPSFISILFQLVLVIRMYFLFIFSYLPIIEISERIGEMKVDWNKLDFIRLSPNAKTLRDVVFSLLSYLYCHSVLYCIALLLLCLVGTCHFATSDQ